MMKGSDARGFHRPDRRRVARGGRRNYDAPGRDPLLLVAESYDEVRRVYVRYLNLFGFLVKEAQNATEAVDGLRSAPRVLLAEPRILMCSAAREWEQTRADLRLRSIPVILLVTDFEAADAAVRGLRPAAVLRKPFHLASLTTAVRRILRADATSVSAQF
jgi:CheY-like chemotaxis protein